MNKRALIEFLEREDAEEVVFIVDNLEHDAPHISVCFDDKGEEILADKIKIEFSL